MKIAGLTRRQTEIARHIAQGETDKRIAAALDVSRLIVGREVRAIAKAWQLDGAKNPRILIARRVLAIDPAA